MQQMKLDDALLFQHGPAGGKAPVAVSQATLPDFVNSSNDLFKDVVELVNNSRAKEDKRNADNVSRSAVLRQSECMYAMNVAAGPMMNARPPTAMQAVSHCSAMPLGNPITSGY